MTAPDDRISAFLDGELDPAERAEVSGMVERDGTWESELALVGEVRDALRSMPPVAPPAGFWAEVMAEVEADEDSATAARSRRNAGHSFRWIGIGVAASVVLFVGALAVPNERSVRPSVTRLAEAHSARAGAAGDPVSPVAPVVVQASLVR